MERLRGPLTLAAAPVMRRPSRSGGGLLGLMMRAALALAAGAAASGAAAHDTGSTQTAAGPQAAEQGQAVQEGAGQGVVEIAIPLRPDAPVPAPVIAVIQGSSVRLVLAGAGARHLHLHGYDIEVDGTEDAPAILAFEARHTGRFALTAHGGEDLLGSGETTLLYIEVRRP